MRIQLIALLVFSLASVFAPAAQVGFTLENIKIRNDFGSLLKKGDAGKEIRVAFLGGSITQNGKGHSGMVPKLLKERLPKAKIMDLNAGLSSTCSTSGAFRLADHVMSRGPLDLLIVEFAVNDDQDAAHSRRDCIRGMEGIIRHVRTKSPHTEIVMVHFVNEAIMSSIQNGKTPLTISAHEQVAQHYGITSVNVAREVSLAIKNGKYTWKDYGGVHPKSFGYSIASEMIVHAIAGGWERSNLPKRTKLPKPIDEHSYANGQFISVKQARTTGAWQVGKVSRNLLPNGAIRRQYESYDLLRGNNAGDEIRLTFEGSSVGAFILAGPDAGTVETSVDGGSVTKHDLFHRYSEKLNYPRSVMFATGLKPGTHELVLKISRNPSKKSSGNSASILFFEVN